ncbi:hypothetical protein PsorP6_012237 [Peronosclerospora sorghi]|uniref:Uncharacterized protein n=1 Tax=Peronosclerospora sorghi TaxID=230839 RepID=A0ACC0WIJ5_9STRA|nr:hypothetical protein PsorP6_012237 [Peronosclerospora sorghi]
MGTVQCLLDHAKIELLRNVTERPLYKTIESLTSFINIHSSHMGPVLNGKKVLLHTIPKTVQLLAIKIQWGEWVAFFGTEVMHLRWTPE